MFSSFSIDHTGPEVRAEARQQLVVVLLISFSPLIIGFLTIASGRTEDLFPGLWNSFSSIFLHGELYFYAMSTCAQIFFLSSFSEEKGIRTMRLASGLFVIFCAAIMALYIGQGDARNTIFHGLLSLMLLIVAVLINYRVIVLSQQPSPMPEAVHRRRAQAMAEDLDPDYD